VRDKERWEQKAINPVTQMEGCDEMGGNKQEWKRGSGAGVITLGVNGCLMALSALNRLISIAWHMSTHKLTIARVGRITLIGACCVESVWAPNRTYTSEIDEFN
jgi:hypothetical protein